jgi:hypothetical protein
MNKLTQKHLLYGAQTFEIIDDEITVTVKGWFKPPEQQQVVLAMLNPEPVVNDGRLEFHSRVKCGPLLSLYINKPNAALFNAFVDVVKKKAQAEYDAFAGLTDS